MVLVIRVLPGSPIKRLFYTLVGLLTGAWLLLRALEGWGAWNDETKADPGID